MKLRVYIRKYVNYRSMIEWTDKCSLSEIINYSILHLFRQRVAICLVLPVRKLPDNCQMPVRCPTRHMSSPIRHLSDKYHLYTRHVPHAHQTYTVPDVHQTYTRHPPYICQIYGICLVYMWYLSDRCLVGVDRCLVTDRAEVGV